MMYNKHCRCQKKTNTNNGVWLSLARAPALGAGGRRFESCHPDSSKRRKEKKYIVIRGCSSMVEH